MAKNKLLDAEEPPVDPWWIGFWLGLALGFLNGVAFF